MTDILARIEQNAGSAPDAPALVRTDGAVLTWALLHERLSRIAAGFRARGLRAGDRVVIGSFRGSEPTEVFLGAQYAGAVPLVVGPTAGALLHALVEHEGVRELFVDDALADAAASTGARVFHTRAEHEWLGPGSGDPMAHRDPNAVSAIQFSTGSTGVPKGVVRTPAMEWADAIGRSQSLGLRPGDRWLTTTPTNTSIAIGAMRTAIAAGGTLVFADSPRDDQLERASTDGVQVMPLQPHDWLSAYESGMAAMLAERGLRIAIVTGSHADRELMARLQGLLDDTDGRVVSVYGLTEVGNVAVSDLQDRTRDKPFSVGQVAQNLKVRIDHPDGQGRGEILISGAAVAQEYVVVTDAGAERRSAQREGWLHTGDVGRFDDDGTLTVYGRQQDALAVSGRAVLPREIEHHLGEAGVGAEVVVLTSTSSAHTGDVVLAGVIDSAMISAVDAGLKLWPGRWRVARCDKMPRNPGGKTDRALLRRMLQDLDSGIELVAEIDSGHR